MHLLQLLPDCTLSLGFLGRFLLFVCICGTKTWGQGTWSGKVTDPSGEPLAFVTLLPEGDPARGILSDIEGKFTISTHLPIQSIVVRYVGFSSLTLDAAFLERHRHLPIHIVLQPAPFDLPEVTILPGDNPADALIRNAIAHRHLNNPERQPAYRCTTYNKFIFEARPHRDELEKWQSQHKRHNKYSPQMQQHFEKSEKEFQRHHLFLMETVTDRRFRSPDQVTEEVLLNRVSGLEQSGMAALASAVQPFSFYGDFLSVLDKNFVNPISPGSTALYFFNIEDTLLAGKDTVWIISFRPRRGKVFESLEGVLHLSQKKWAVQNVRATPVFSGGNLSMKIEQQYQFVEDSTSDRGFWFPEQLNFELEFQKYPSQLIGIKAVGKSYISHPQILKKIPASLINPEQPLYFQKHAETRADSLWQPWHLRYPLLTKEQETYRWADSIGAAKKLDKWTTVLRVLNTGMLPLNSWLNVNLLELFRFNDFEQMRIGIGLNTAQSNPNLLSKKWESGAYVGYGLADGVWKYGAHLLWRLHRNHETQLRLDYQNDLTEPGILFELPTAQVLNRSLYARRLDHTDTWQLRLSSRLWTGANVSCSLRRQFVRPNYAYQYQDEHIAASSFLFFESSFYFRQTYDERVTHFFSTSADRLQRFPVFEGAWTRGKFNKTSTYNRYLLALHQSVWLRRLGRLSYHLELGKADKQAPLPRLFTQNQSAGGSSFALLFVPNTFQTLPDTLWLADRFFNFFLAHEVGNILYKKRWSAPRLTLLYNMAWSSLGEPKRHREIGFLTANPPLFESGIRLDRLLVVNYVNFAYLGLGGAAFYRWGAFSDTRWRRNLVFRLAFRLNF